MPSVMERVATANKTAKNTDAVVINVLRLFRHIFNQASFKNILF